MNWLSLIQCGDVTVCLQPAWCCPTDKSGISLQAFGNLLLWDSSGSLQSNVIALHKKTQTPFLLFYLDGNLLFNLLVCLLAALSRHPCLYLSASPGCHIHRTNSSLPSLRYLQLQLCHPTIHVRLPLEVHQAFISCGFVSFSAH